MRTVFIRFSTHEDRVRGFYELATRSSISSFPGEIYQIPIEALRLLDEQHVAYRRATDAEERRTKSGSDAKQSGDESPHSKALRRHGGRRGDGRAR